MTQTHEVDELAVRFDLITKVKKAGGQTAFARQHGIDRYEVNVACRGTRSPSLAVLNALGYRKVTRYVRSTP